MATEPADARSLAPEGPEDPAAEEVPVEERLLELPQSARTVYDVLQREGPLTHKDLCNVADMPGRTIRYAIRRLKEAGIIGWRCNFMDCRQCFFYVQDICEGKPEHRKVKGS